MRSVPSLRPALIPAPAASAPAHRGARRLGLPTPSRPSLSRRALALVVAVLTLAATLLGLDLRGSVAHADDGYSPASTAIRYGLDHLGAPYVYGATGPSVFDCSGLTGAAYKAAGISLPRTSRQQWYAGKRFPLSQAQPGDLVFWASNTSAPSTIYHVAIWLSKDRILEAPHTGDVVKIAPIYSHNLMQWVVRPAPDAAPVLDPWPSTWGDGSTIIQQRLRANGLPVAVTGHYDSSTRAAVVQLQERYGIPYDDGTVQWRTWMALMSHGAAKQTS